MSPWSVKGGADNSRSGQVTWSLGPLATRRLPNIPGGEIRRLAVCQPKNAPFFIYHPRRNPPEPYLEDRRPQRDCPHRCTVSRPGVTRDSTRRVKPVIARRGRVRFGYDLRAGCHRYLADFAGSSSHENQSGYIWSPVAKTVSVRAGCTTCRA